MAKRYLHASPHERAQMRHRRFLQLTGRQPQRVETRHEAWNRLIAEGRELELVTLLEPFVVRVGDQVIGRSVYRTGQFDFDKFELALSCLGLRRLRVLVDVGANIGTVCIPAVRRGLAERAVAIEPDPLNFSLLTANVALNGLLGAIERHQVAAAPASRKSLHLALASANLGDHRIASDHPSQADHRKSVVVDGVALDDLVPDLSASTDMIFMDVQGFEAQVLRGATSLVERRIPMVIELWPAGLDAHGGLGELAPMLDPFRSFVNLRDPTRTEQPVALLPQLYAELVEQGSDADTDILLR